MSGIPSKCPKCCRTEIVNPSGAGIPTRFGRVRTGIIVKGLFAKPIKRALGFYKVTYRCHRCGFRQEYELPN